MFSDETAWNPCNAFDAFTQTCTHQPGSFDIEHHDVVMVLGPVVPHKNQRGPPQLQSVMRNQRGDTDGLMASAHRHDTPPVVDLLTDRRGHGLRFELNLLQAPKCSPAGGSVHSITNHSDTATPLGPAPSSHQIWHETRSG